MEKLTRDAILAAEDLRTEEVPVPEWGGSVIVRTLRGDDRDAYDLACYASRKARKLAGQSEREDHIRSRLVAWTVVDEAGNRLFSDDDADALGQKSSAALDRVCDVAQRLNGVGAAEVAELAKNSGTEPGDDSPSA